MLLLQLGQVALKGEKMTLILQTIYEVLCWPIVLYELIKETIKDLRTSVQIFETKNFRMLTFLIL